jgi:hypothetical protein
MTGAGGTGKFIGTTFWKVKKSKGNSLEIEHYKFLHHHEP